MLKKALLSWIENRGYRLIKKGQLLYGEPVGNELENDFLAIYQQCRPYTMTSLERMYAAHKAATYIVDNEVEGAIVECGVWKGGSTMMMVKTLLQRGVTDREIYLYDTYEGMPEPTEKDKDLAGTSAQGTWSDNQTDTVNEWCYSPLEEVQKNIYATGYPKEKIHFVKGKVEDTIPGTLPTAIALLRLDTDWYDSTYHELVHLYPLLQVKGALIIDDYGHWQGAREAVDQYFAENQINMLLNRIDYTGRIGLKLQ
ncbi:MAG: TylF/MycF/NovP-related O-methyltransferase [Spirosomataceae bacterium]